MDQPPIAPISRRQFLHTTAAAAALALLARSRGLGAISDAAGAGAGAASPTVPWFRRALRWGQVNLTEIDPERFDLAAWRAHWRRTCLQGVIVNAGGIVAYYPTQVPFHRRARFLGDGDLFGTICRAAHEDGLAVFARMDSNRADRAFFEAHPDWFTRNAEGQPYRVTDLYVACVNGPYYREHIPAILREVATRYRPQGFTDNNWNGAMRHQPCFCANCEHAFRARTGQPIPRTAQWNDPVYREWIRWNYERRLEIWDEFNRLTRSAGGPECVWVGMMAGSQNWQARVFRDDREIYRRTEIVMLDDQHRFPTEGFQHNGEIGGRIRSVGGWDKIIPESMALYSLTDHNFRLSAQTEPEVRLWVLEGIAGGVQPWWHHVGSYQPDRRMLKIAEPLWRWHRDHEAYLINRRPVVTVGLLWSQRNMDWFGRDDGGPLVDDPWNGWMQALVRGRVPYVPVHADDIERASGELGLRLLILPNLAVITDDQAAALRRFVEGGGSLVSTGLSTLLNQEGDLRSDFALADVFGLHVPAGHGFRDEAKRAGWAREWQQTYLRLTPPAGGTADVPPASSLHPVLRGFEDTEVLAFGGVLEAVAVDAGAVVPLTYVPPVPTMPVESVWMHEPATDIPALVLRETAAGGRVACLLADVDRRFARDYLPEHGDLLASITRWAAKDELPLRVVGRGFIDCHLYRQPGRLILHLVNLTNAGTWRTPVHELIPVGPFDVGVRRPEGAAGAGLRVRSLVSGQSVAANTDGGWVSFRLPVIQDHEVLVIE